MSKKRIRHSKIGKKYLYDDNKVREILDEMLLRDSVDVSALREYLNKLKRYFVINLQEKVNKSEYPSLGISLEALRLIAKTFDLTDMLDTNLYYDEVLVKGLSLAYQKEPIHSKWNKINEYLELVDSWALVDSVATSFKLSKDELDPVFKELMDYLSSDNEYYQRFAQMIFQSQYIKLNEDYKSKPPIHLLELPHLRNAELGKDHPYIPRILEVINREFRDDESSLGAAKLGATIFQIAPYMMFEFLKNDQLDDKTHNRIIDRILRSKTVSKAVNHEVKQLKRYDD